MKLASGESMFFCVNRKKCIFGKQISMTIHIVVWKLFIKSTYWSYAKKLSYLMHFFVATRGVLVLSYIGCGSRRVAKRGIRN